MSAADRINARDAEIESEEFVALFTPPPAAPSPAAAGLPLEDVERMARVLREIAQRHDALQLTADEMAALELAAAALALRKRNADLREVLALAEMRPTAAVPDPRFRDQLVETLIDARLIRWREVDLALEYVNTLMPVITAEVEARVQAAANQEELPQPIEGFFAPNGEQMTAVPFRAREEPDL